MDNNQLLQMLQGQLSDDMMDQLTRQIGGASREQTAVASKSIISTLLGGLSQNAAREEGAKSIDHALERDHDGSILDDALGFLSGQKEVQTQKMVDGGGIVNHILGEKKGGILDMVSRMSGLDSGKAGNLMSLLAPVVMGALGKTKRQQGLDVNGIASLLMSLTGGGQQQSPQQQPQQGLLNSLLDQDNDGSVMDDVAGMGLKLLGNFFK